ncbi:hypothetical protein L208DRAFT_1265478 [Tricholoma matsutake]|nr:hypothetical protein L208DRAFT_1265478 [Tricholoma matsutake 945]
MAFNLTDFLPGLLFVGELPATKPKRKRPTYRPTKDWPALDSRLVSWLKSVHENDPLRGVRAMYDILSHQKHVKLVRTSSKSIRSPEDIVTLLEETNEWGKEWAGPLAELVMTYNVELKATASKSNHPQKKRKTT